jgi:uncharacterized protein YjdB
VLPLIFVSVNPASATVRSGQTVQLAATVTGTTNTAVTWSVTPAVGTVTAGGLYTPPATIASRQVITVTATSAQDNTRNATAAITLEPAAPLSITPNQTSLGPQQSQQFAMTDPNAPNATAIWAVTPNVGTLSTSGARAVYTSPASFDQSTSVEVRAVSSADATRSVTARVNLNPVVAVSVNNATSTLSPGQSFQFAATVTGTLNKAVTWSLQPNVGTISPGGLYSAPLSVAAPTSVSVIAQSVADPSKTARGTVAVQPASSTPRVTFTMNDRSLTSLWYGNTNFSNSFMMVVDEVVNGAVFRAPDGTETSLGWINANRAVRRKLTNPEGFEHIYRNGLPRQFTVRAEYTTPTDNTLRIDVAITNQDATEDLVRTKLRLLNMQLPAPYQAYRSDYGLMVNQFTGYPAETMTGPWGTVALWQDGSQNNGAISGGSADRLFFTFSFTNYFTRYRTQGGAFYEDVIAPGATKRYTYYVRFSNQIQEATAIAPEAYQQIRAALPVILNWPDRRPIGNWFISEGTKRNARNPRGYLNDASLDALNPTVFRNAVLAQTDNVIRLMNNMNPRPQGLIIWDLEGQEFPHVFTYVGSPDKLPDLAPEMNAVADEMFSRLRAAGYQPGLTLRPQTFLTGAELPATCISDSSYSYQEKFVKTDAPLGYRGYSCTAPNVWTQGGLAGLWDQRLLEDDDAILAELVRKAAYARDRWGVKIFYVDSNVWTGGNTIFSQLFRKLAQQFPDCLFIPEWKDLTYYFGATAPYQQANMGALRTSDLAKQLYPDAFSVVNLAEADTVTNRQELVKGVRGGDILLFRAWFNSPDMTAAQSIYREAMNLP